MSKANTTAEDIMTNTEIRKLADSIKDQLPLVEVHILRPTSGELLNRDFHNRHKTITLGGTRRARVSSQSIKHAIRVKLEAEDKDSTQTRALPQIIKKRLKSDGASEYAMDIVDKIFDKNELNKKSQSLGTLTSQINAITIHDTDAFVQAVYDAEKQYPSDIKKAATVARKVLTDSADTRRLSPLTALLGRMATSPLMSDVESAVEMGHAYGVSRYAGDIDDYTACDDYLAQMGIITGDKEDTSVRQAGSAFMDTSDISSTTYYEYVSISERILFENLCRGRKLEDRDEILKLTKDYTSRFIKELVFTLPTAKQHTMATHAEPDVVYITTGVGVYPQTMDGAFERAVSGDEERSVSDRAVERLKEKIADRRDGAFAVNAYSSEWWISDRYDAPDGVEELTVRDLDRIV